MSSFIYRGGDGNNNRMFPPRFSCRMIQFFFLISSVLLCLVVRGQQNHHPLTPLLLSGVDHQVQTTVVVSSLGVPSCGFLSMLGFFQLQRLPSGP